MISNQGAGCPVFFFMGHLMAQRTFRRVNMAIACLGVYFLLAFAGSAIVDAQDTAKRTLGELQVWSEMHQKGDEEQFKRIDSLEKRLSDGDVKLEARLARLENNQQSVIATLDGMTWWMRMLALAVAVQLINMVWKLATRARGEAVDILDHAE